jgi:peptide chain release factor subunit 1
MITFIVPANSEISQYSSRINYEITTASNIKSRVNRKSVLGALNNIKQVLKNLTKSTISSNSENYAKGKSGNGLMLYSTAEEVKVVEPKVPINKGNYICGSKFDLTLLKSFLETDEPLFYYIIIDGESFVLATVQNYSDTLQTNILESKKSFIRSRTRRGGQSALRFDRNRDITESQFVKDGFEKFRNLFNENREIGKNVVVGGSSNVKREFVEMLNSIRVKPLKVVDVSYSAERGLQEAISITKDTIKSYKEDKNSLKIGEFFEKIESNIEMCVYGEEEVTEYINKGNLEKLFIGFRKFQNRKDYWTDLTESFGTEITTVKGISSDGHSFITDYGGLGGIKRYID